MRTGMRQGPIIKPQRPWRMLAIALVLSLLFGLVGMGAPLEKTLRIARNKINPVSASGDIVVVAIDDASQKALGAWPWPREVHAELVKQITAAGAAKIVIDDTFNYQANKVADEAFAKALHESGRVVLPVNLRSGEGVGQIDDTRPNAMIANQVQLGVISLPYDYTGSAWSLPFGMEHAGYHYHSYASIMAGLTGKPGELFPVNYRINIDSIPKYSVLQILREKPGNRLRGKTVIIGATSEKIGDIFTVPGRGRKGGVFIHVLGAETLKRGVPVELGWLPMLLAMIPLVVMATRFNRVRAQVLTLSLALVGALGVPIFSESRQWFIDITPAIFLLLCVSSALMWRRYRLRGTVNLSSGLPNLIALRTSPHQRDRALIVARIINYPQLAAAVSTTANRHWSIRSCSG